MMQYELNLVMYPFMSCARSAVQPLEARLEPLASAACFFVLSFNIHISI